MLKCKFKCDICQKQFRTSQHLRQHQGRKKPCTSDSVYTTTESSSSGNNSSSSICSNNTTQHLLNNIFSNNSNNNNNNNNLSNDDFFEKYNILLKEVTILKNKLLEEQHSKMKLRVENNRLKSKVFFVNNFIVRYMNDEDDFEPLTILNSITARNRAQRNNQINNQNKFEFIHSPPSFINDSLNEPYSSMSSITGSNSIPNSLRESSNPDAKESDNILIGFKENV